MKKLINLLCLALCLCLAVPALAAPHRDRRTVTDLSEELETAVSLFGGASLLRDVYELKEGEPVPQALEEGALLVGFGRHLLPNLDGDATDGKETATVSVAIA